MKKNNELIFFHHIFHMLLTNSEKLRCIYHRFNINLHVFQNFAIIHISLKQQVGQ
jgi:hypothetical protein